MKKYDKRRVDRGFSLLLSISLVFIFLGMIVFSVFRKISVEMLESATQNLSESLNLIQCTIEAILNNEAEFQKLLAQEIALVEDPEEQIRSYGRNQVMAKISLVWEGERQGRRIKFYNRQDGKWPGCFTNLSKLYGGMGIYHEMPGCEGRQEDCGYLCGIYL